MAKLKIGVELAGLRLPTRDALVAAAQCRADAVEVDARGEISPQISDTGIRHIRKILDDLGLHVSAVAFRLKGGYSSTEGLERRVDATKSAMELAYRLGASVVVNHLGPIPVDQKGSAAWDLLLEVLSDLGAHGNRVGALLAAETGDQSPEDLARVLGALPEGTLGADLNPGRLLLHGFSPLEAVSVLGRWILHVHASDATVPSSREVAQPAVPGRGAVDYPALLGALEEYGYRGYLTVQVPGHDDPRKEAAAAVSYLRRL